MIIRRLLLPIVYFATCVWKCDVRLVNLSNMLNFWIFQDDAPRPGAPGQGPRPAGAGAPART